MRDQLKPFTSVKEMISEACLWLNDYIAPSIQLDKDACLEYAQNEIDDAISFLHEVGYEKIAVSVPGENTSRIKEEIVYEPAVQAEEVLCKFKNDYFIKHEINPTLIKEIEEIIPSKFSIYLKLEQEYGAALN